MAQGILGGVALGVVFSVGLAGAISMLMPLEPSPAPQVVTAVPGALPTPEASDVSQAPISGAEEGVSTAAAPQSAPLPAPVSEEPPTAPAAAAQPPELNTDLTADIDGGTQGEAAAQAPVAAPQAEEQVQITPPAPVQTADLDTAEEAPQMPAPTPQPQPGTAEDLTPPRPLPEDITARAGEDDPVLPNPQALAPMIPDEGAPLPDLADATTPPQEQARAVAQPEVTEPPQADGAVEAAPQDATAEADGPDAQTEAQTAEPDTQVALAPKPRVLPAPDSQGVTIGTPVRPQIGTPANTLVAPDTPAPDAAPEDAPETAEATDTAADARPVTRFAQPFENPDDKPLMSIVLMDTGVDLEAEGIGLPALSSFPYPVSFAVDVALADAAERMERYRAEGFEVLAMVDLPTGAQPSDAEVSLSVAMGALPQIVGVLEGTGEGLQANREVADQVTGILRDSGHGLVTQSRGLNSMPTLARREGVPAAPVFRDFDSAGQDARVIRRFLDQAAFRADQEGGVIMLGRLRPETIEALLVWGLADRAGSVALAPVSALLLAQP